MFDITRQIKESIKQVLLELNLPDDIEYTLEHPANETNGDYAVNVAMVLFPRVSSDTHFKNPRDLALKIIEKLRIVWNHSEYVLKVETAGPGFINFYLTGKYFIDRMINVSNLVPPKSTGQKISLEHTDVNPNKEPHVGHLRNASIGDSLVRVLRYMGNDVKVQYYQNDVGQQIASIVLAYKKQYVPFNISFWEDSDALLKWASQAYVDIENRIGAETDLKKEKEFIQISIMSMSKNSEDSKLAVQITDGILKATLKIFQRLDISYDLVIRESDILKNKLWESTFELLKNNEKFYKADSGDRKGCWLIRMPDSDDKVIVRSNGLPTYAGNDIAYHLWKFGILKDFQYDEFDTGIQNAPLYVTSTGGHRKDMDTFAPADKIINVIDISQTYPQKSVKQALEILGYDKLTNNYQHVNYGFVFLSLGTAKKFGIKFNEMDKVVKMSGRKGSVISINHFLQVLKERLSSEYGDFASIEDVLSGAVKFEMLKYDTYQDIVFDISTALDQKGFSSPYIQYVFARASSVLKMAGYVDSAADLSSVNNINKEEYDVLRKLSKYGEVLQRVAEELAPHYLCQYLFELSKNFNTFYNSNHIIGSDKENFRLKLTYSVSLIIKHGLFLLGIKAPNEL